MPYISFKIILKKRPHLSRIIIKIQIGRGSDVEIFFQLNKIQMKDKVY